MADLTVELFGKTLKNPVMNASGTMGYGVEMEPLWDIKNMGAYVTKGLSLKPHHGNPPPRIWEERHGMINSIGLHNIGIDAFFNNFMPFFEKKELPVIINFFGFSEEEYIECARQIKPHRLIVCLEANLSCPNIKAGGISFGKEPENVYRLVKKIKSVTEIPVIAKLTPEVKNISDIAMAAYDAGADGLTLINTIPGIYVDIDNKNIPIKGGLSGPFLKPIALKAIKECSERVPIPIIGVGGIMDWKDAVAFFMAGARAVQVGTATFVDPFTIPKIIENIGEFINSKGYSSIKDIIGVVNT
ncbi:MAG: dihydroorotate dehydrogenase [Syntrophorhabdaceae bacterium]|nr:dihydroorotate dehydrogenase [Syntrophorhabdaceae bacterium]